MDRNVSPHDMPPLLAKPGERKKKFTFARLCLLGCGGCLAAALVAGLLLAVLLQRIVTVPLVAEDYHTKTPASLPMEKRYTAFGPQEVKSIESESHQGFFKHFKIWYPSELETNSARQYPLVVFANGTGVVYSRYTPIFRHLASWGFVAIGNDDPSSMFGKSTSLTLDYILSINQNPQSIFFGKLDTNHIGVTGHSQGAVGAVHAVTDFQNGRFFTSLYTASATSQSLIRIPYFMVAGTGKFDAGVTAPLAALLQGYDKVQENVPAVMARRKDVDHGDVLTHADGYMTAWFRYTLMNDLEAEKVFAGKSPEILMNSVNWQDVKTKNASAHDE